MCMQVNGTLLPSQMQTSHRHRNTCLPQWMTYMTMNHSLFGELWRSLWFSGSDPFFSRSSSFICLVLFCTSESSLSLPSVALFREEEHSCTNSLAYSWLMAFPSYLPLAHMETFTSSCHCSTVQKKTLKGKWKGQELRGQIPHWVPGSWNQQPNTKFELGPVCCFDKLNN